MGKKQKKKLRDYRGGTFSSEIRHSACVSIFDMLHSFAPRYSHPSIRHLQPSLMLGPCKPGQRRGCGCTQTFLKRFRCQLRARQANMKNPAGPKVGAGTFYDVFSWQQVTKNITWDSGVSCQNQNNLYRAVLWGCDILVHYWDYVSLSDHWYCWKVLHFYTVLSLIQLLQPNIQINIMSEFLQLL